ncbi:hypothetical protein TNCT_197791 [Trichonephila clavata]|uniref:Uncharacterized protein n=1 Tax=Trichonephila clavata TaxID=2740835 RepID=A0A8X6M3S8_TRICU|nr:hypothetical protein TNCT_197791 [Trichonephila clavata]
MMEDEITLQVSCQEISGRILQVLIITKGVQKNVTFVQSGATSMYRNVRKDWTFSSQRTAWTLMKAVASFVLEEVDLSRDVGIRKVNLDERHFLSHVWPFALDDGIVIEELTDALLSKVKVTEAHVALWFSRFTIENIHSNILVVRALIRI